jgi:oligosaccharide repeat unit polymerase
MIIINITTDLVFILLHLFFLLFSYEMSGKKFFHPAVLFSFIWTGILALHFIFRFTLLDKLEPLHLNVYLIFFIGNLFYIFGSILADLAFKRKGAKQITDLNNGFQTIPNIRLRLIITAVIVLGLPFYIYASYKIFLVSQAENFFGGLRYELAYGDADIGPLKYLMPFAFVVFAFNLYSFYLRRNSVNRVYLIITLFALIIYAVFATGRTYFLMILAIYAGISFLVNPAISLKRYFFAFIVFFVIFLGIGIIYGKGGSTDDSFKNNVQSSIANAGIYLVTSLNALDIETSHRSISLDQEDNTFRFFTKVGIQLDIIKKRRISDIFQEFVFVPYATNVFTYYSPYIRDFGRIYAWITLAFFGAIHTYFYNRGLYIKRLRSIFYYSFLLFPLLLSFFADQYMSLFSFWVQIVFFTELLLYIDRKVGLNKDFKRANR